MDQKNKPLEQRSYHFEVRAEESEAGNIITGRPIVYNSRTDLGWFDEIIEPGALNNTDLTDVRFLVNHDTSKIPLARSRRNNGNSTMQLTTDNDGLGIRDEEWENLDSDHPTHHIRDISTVVEVSAVTFPAYESTEINARSKEALDNARSAVETARQQGAPSVETDDLELLKEKAKILGGF